MATNYRAELEALMRATINDEAAHHDWTYHAVRPCPVPPSWHPGQRVWGDCSKGVQFLLRWCAAPFDPMARNNGGHFWGNYGNSQTIWLACQHLDHASELKVGDFVTFGFNGSEHATMVFEAGADPVLWSFGHQGAPNLYRLSQDPRPRQFCRNPLPTYIPTPQDKLRAKTGWFAWMAWYEGEGDWRNYGPKNPKVRPNVPSVIPPTWWARRVQFLLRRKRGS